MQIQSRANQYNGSFCSKIIMTPGAIDYINGKEPARQAEFKKSIKKLEKNGNNDVILFDKTFPTEDIKMSCYKMDKGKLVSSEFPIRCGVKIPEWEYKQVSGSFVPVRRTNYDKYNPVLASIKELCAEGE